MNFQYRHLWGYLSNYFELRPTRFTLTPLLESDMRPHHSNQSKRYFRSHQTIDPIFRLPEWKNCNHLLHLWPLDYLLNFDWDQFGYADKNSRQNNHYQLHWNHQFIHQINLAKIPPNPMDIAWLHSSSPTSSAFCSRVWSIEFARFSSECPWKLFFSNFIWTRCWQRIYHEHRAAQLPQFDAVHFPFFPIPWMWSWVLPLLTRGPHSDSTLASRQYWLHVSACFCLGSHMIRPFWTIFTTNNSFYV